MELRNKQTGATITDSEFRAAFPNTGFPVHITEATYNEFGYDVVFEGPQASGGTVYQYSQRQGVEQMNGKWYTKYVLGPVFTDRPATETEPAQTAAEQEAAYKAQKDEEQAKSVRNTRTEKLRDCDWTQLDDTPMSNTQKADWAEYRQALRDVPNQAGFPFDIEWPTQPE